MCKLTRRCGPLLLSVLVSACTASAQPAGVAVRPEFRTPPRALVVRPIDRSRTVIAPGALTRAAASAQDAGRRDSSASMIGMQLILKRPAERQAAFDAQVEALHQPGSASYHRWLTPAEVGAQFGPAPEDLAALRSYLEGEGFTISRIGESGMYVDFSGTVAQVERSFNTEIHTVHLADGQDHFAAVKEAEIPEALSPLVRGFVSLSDLNSIRPNYRKAVPATSRAAGLTGASPLDDVSSNNYAVGPQDFYAIYNENPLLTQSTRIDGTGVTIALIEQSAITDSDVTFFRNTFGVTPATPVSLTTQNGPSSNCNVPGLLKNQGDEGEAILDIEWAGSVAPGANLLYVQCASKTSTAGVLLSAEAAIDSNVADILSLSYGEYEGGGTDITLANDLWEQAASQGQTVVVSAGDSGPAVLDDGANVARNGITESGFSSTAWNVSAGGTDFMDLYNQSEGDPAYGISTFWSTTTAPAESAKGYIPEMPWNDTCASSIYNAYAKGMSADGATLCSTTKTQQLYLAAGSGGPSALYARPSWQTGTVYGLPSLAAQPNRLQPDVSLFASNGFWFHDLPSYESDEGANALSYAGGTSFVAPQLAGVFALIKQKTGERLGQPNYVLYNLAGHEYGVGSFTGGGCNGSGASGVGTTSSLPASNCIFNDVQTGNISVDCVAGTPNCYALGSASYGILSTSSTSEQPAFATNAGWDMATGIGSLNITNLVNNWQAASAGGTLFTPVIAAGRSTASYTYGLPSAITYSAAVSGPGSYPTGSVTFSGSPAIGTIGTDPLIQSAGCSTGSTCTETAAQTYTPPGMLPAGTYTITAAYLSTNENYATGSNTTSLTVNQQTPTVNVSNVSISAGTTANLPATIAFTGTGAAPTGGLTFRVDAGATVTALCTGSSTPLSCTYSGYDTTALAIGSHTITAVALADGNYASATGTGTLMVNPAPTIVFTVPNHHTEDSSFSVTATSNSSGSITYSVVSGPAMISGNTVTLTGIAGTVVLQASQAASASYGAGTQNASFQVIAGSVWFGNSTGSLSSFDLSGTPITSASGYTGGGVGGIAGPLGLAFDASGNVWVASSNGLSEFTRQGVAVSGTASTVGGINHPLAVAVDGLGQVWLVNNAGTVSVVSNAGAAISPATGYSAPGTTPSGIAIDISGSVWIPSKTANTVTRILGAAAPVVPLATGAASSPGVEP